MKRILITSMMIVSMLLSSCNWDDFGDLNVNPNEATTPKTSMLLTNSIIPIGNNIIATQGALYAQYLSNKQYTSADNYQTIIFSTDGFYNGPLMDLQKIIEMNTETPTTVVVDGYNDNQIAIAKILMAYYYLYMTDRWGDLPFSEALKGPAQLRPKYDSQEDIYEGCFQLLKDAVDMIDTRSPVEGIAKVNGDALFDGDMEMWIKFANTIRLKAALRLSNVAPVVAAAEFLDAYNDGVIALDNSENITYQYQALQAYENPYYNSFVTAGRRDWVIADPFMNMLQADTYASPHRDFYSDGHPYKTQTGMLDVAADPRLPVYANPIQGTPDTFIGMPYGLTEGEAGSIPAVQTSFMGNAFREQTTPAYIFNSAEVAFILAEGRLRNWITDRTVQEFYEDGIAASLEQHGVSAGYATYITNDIVAYDPARALEQIITQKWIAIYPNGYEAWSEWRRTGFPALAPPDGAMTPNLEIPRRQAYGTNEANLNSENYKAALANQGFATDDLTGRVWWDVEP